MIGGSASSIRRATTVLIATMAPQISRGVTNTQQQDFSVDFTIPDSNCNGVLDEDFDVDLESQVVEDGETDTKTQRLSFRNGKWSLAT